MSSLVRRLARLGFLVGMAGCASAPPERGARPIAAARLDIVNLTARAWDVTFTAPGGETRKERIAPEGRIAVTAVAGASAFEQTLLDPRGEPVATRTIAIQLKPGETYTLPLATLMSGGNGGRSVSP